MSRQLVAAAGDTGVLCNTHPTQCQMRQVEFRLSHCAHFGPFNIASFPSLARTPCKLPDADKAAPLGLELCTPRLLGRPPSRSAGVLCRSIASLLSSSTGAQACMQGMRPMAFQDAFLCMSGTAHYCATGPHDLTAQLLAQVGSLRVKLQR